MLTIQEGDALCLFNPELQRGAVGGILREQQRTHDRLFLLQAWEQSTEGLGDTAMSA